MGIEGNESTLSVLERFANQNYIYGREWLTSQVQIIKYHHILFFMVQYVHVHNVFDFSIQVRGFTTDNTSGLEHHVVELYDQLYHYFVLNVSIYLVFSPLRSFPTLSFPFFFLSRIRHHS